MFRRSEILLPLSYNDGTRIERTKHLQTWKELVARFGAVTIEPQVLEGHWVHAEVEYEDALIRLVVDVPDSHEVREFFRGFKETLKERFDQLDIWVTSHAIDVI